MPEAREVGRTAAAGWQIGVRRTVPGSFDEVWALLRSDEGMRVWLGGSIDLAPGPYRLDDGTAGEVRVDEHGSHIRLTWDRAGGDRPSLIQVRVTPAATGATISFHQEHLADAGERELMREHWARVIDDLRERLGRA